MENKIKRGFASMDKEKNKAIGSKGGKALVAKRGTEYFEELGRKSF